MTTFSYPDAELLADEIQGFMKIHISQTLFMQL